MAHAVLFSIIAGYSAGVLGGYLLTKRIILWLSRRCTKPRLVALLATVGALAALLPAFLLSTFVRGTVGGGYGEATTHALGLGMLGVPIGLGLGLAIVLAVITGGGALLGAVIARLIASCQAPRAAI